MEIVYKEPDLSIEQDALSRGLSPLQARILANRLQGTTLDEFWFKYQNGLPSPFTMGDMQPSAERLADAIMNQELIWVVSDFDNDGIAGMAVAKSILLDVFNHPRIRLDDQITHRDQDGYGLTMGAVQKMEKAYTQKTKPNLLITIDIGSSNGPETDYLAKEYPEIDIIITDHHSVPETGYPVNVLGFINPNKPNDEFEDGSICGATVVFYLMVATCEVLIKRGYLSPETNVWSAAPYLASATIADCVSLKSPLNRELVKYGIGMINQSTLPTWTALKNQFAGEPGQRITAETMGWNLGPMINSNSRMGRNGSIPLDFLTAKTNVEAEKNLEDMVALNKERKDLQGDILQRAIKEAEKQVDQNAIVIHLEDGIAGVGGIVAARIKEQMGKPVIMLTSIGENASTGSARSIPGLSILEAIRTAEKRLPGAIYKAGGHNAAAGMTIKTECIPAFREKLVEAVNEMVGGKELVPVYEVDMELKGHHINPRILDEIEALEPYGQKFEAPVFEVRGIVQSWEPVSKKTHVHARVTVQMEDGTSLPLVWWNALKEDEYEPKLVPGQPIRAAVSLSKNFWKGRVSLQAMMQGYIA